MFTGTRAPAPGTPASMLDARTYACIVGFYAIVIVAPWTGCLVALAALAIAIGCSTRWSPPAARPASTAFLVASVLLVAFATVPFLVTPVSAAGLVLIAQWCALPVAAALFWFAPRSDRAVTAVWVGAIIGAVGSAVVALTQVVVLGLNRAEGWHGNAIVFGDLALLTGALALALHPVAVPDPAGRWSQRATSATGAAVASGVTACVLSGSRGGWLAVPVIGGLLTVHRWRDRVTARQLRRTAGAGVFGVVAAVVTGGGMPVARIDAGLSDVSQYVGASPSEAAAGTSIGARVEAWRSAWDAFVHHPVFGVGWGNLQDHFRMQVAAGQRNPRIATFTHAHHQPLGMLASNGLVGALAWIAVLGVPAVFFTRAWRSGVARDRALGTAGLLVVAAYAVFGLTEAIFEHLVPVAFYAVTVAALTSQLGGAPEGAGGAAAGATEAGRGRLRT